MPATQKLYWQATCDKCGEQLDSAGYGGFTVYENLAELLDGMDCSDWQHRDVGKAHAIVLCDSCFGCIKDMLEEDEDEDKQFNDVMDHYAKQKATADSQQ